MGARRRSRPRPAEPRRSPDVDAVIHTAYVQGEGEWEVNVDGSAAVAEAARGVRLVHLSSDLVFDGSRGRYREEDEPAPVNSYGRSKAEAERRVAALHPEAPIVAHVADLRRPGARPAGAARPRRDRRFFVDEIRSPVQVGDLADALLELLELSTSRAAAPRRAPTTCRGSTSPCCSAPTRPGSKPAARRPTGRRTSRSTARVPRRSCATRAPRCLRSALGLLSPALGRRAALGRAQEMLERDVQERGLALGERSRRRRRSTR